MKKSIFITVLAISANIAAADVKLAILQDLVAERLLPFVCSFVEDADIKTDIVYKTCNTVREEIKEINKLPEKLRIKILHVVLSDLMRELKHPIITESEAKALEKDVEESFRTYLKSISKSA
ncbi:hypothetical protein A3F66_04980 [candidate division TM6 bacterium RIFCSPHIGHO2_12_FULL_32_22]|nr:MAG: hypothetical protein A3F66_04980 [candidate division TM6 bacterium RIFCSPHIGHO2_12_FULL_32_22]